MAVYAGLMSGTSLDGMDGVLVEFADNASQPLRVLAFEHRPFGAALRAELLALNAPGGQDELHRAALAANAVARIGADVALALRARVPDARIVAVGSHGQTARHRPELGFTTQLNNGALLAELCGLDVVCDFRSRDVAAGGQGAPLVPAFHAEVFGSAQEARAVLNLGGIANLTLLGGPRVLGFDCGPANLLMDGWAARHLGKPYDDGGRWAASGRVDADLLARLLADPFFGLPPPKSTGRDLFHAAWLQQSLSGREAPADVQATLAELTARGAADALRRHASATRRLLVCGGGAGNTHLIRRLAALLPGVAVEPTDAHGLPATQVEAVAFAWLARAFVERRAGNRPEVTGASGPRVLGALYPA
jgi:anhydro-N-acetylmuramic acid kinase